MKRFKVIVLIFFFGLLTVLVFNPIIIDTSDDVENVNTLHLEKGDTIKVLQSFDFTNDDIKAVLIIKDQINLAKNIPNGRVLTLSDKDILKKMQEEWLFLYNGGDLSTVENEFLLYKNNDLVLRCGIVLDNNIQGLQDHKFGFVKATSDVSNYFAQFKRVYLPVVFL